MRWTSSLLCLLVIAALAGPARATAPIAREERGAQSFGADKFWDYALCGASIVFAAGTGGWVLAFIACGKAATTHWTE